MADTGVMADEDAVLHRAMCLFWDRGVEATSYPEIVAATGQSRKALYARWPDKAALVRDAIASYRRDVLGRMLALLEPPGTAALERFWSAIKTAAEGQAGCYLFRSAGGELRGDAVVAAVFQDYLVALHGRLERAISAAGHADRAGQAAWAAIGCIALISSLAAQRAPSDLLEQATAAGRAACGLGNSPGR